MGNIRGWGGPLSQNWNSRSLVLQQLILNRMRSLGIIPVLPAFAGHLPRAFKKYNIITSKKTTNSQNYYFKPQPQDFIQMLKWKNWAYGTILTTHTVALIFWIPPKSCLTKLDGLL